MTQDQSYTQSQKPEKPTWTAEDFRSGDAPFAYLWELRGDPLAQQQAVEDMKNTAAVLGIKGFAGLWRAYQASQKYKARQMYVQSSLLSRTDFSDAPIELLCGGYICNDDGVTAVSAHADGSGRETLVCSHPILPVRRLVNAETEEVKLELAWRREGGRWRSRTFPKSLLASATGIVGLAAADIAVTSENARALVKYIADLDSLNYNLIPVERSIDRLGWVTGNALSPASRELSRRGSLSGNDLPQASPDGGGVTPAGRDGEGLSPPKKSFVPYTEGIRFDGEDTFGHTYAAVRPHGDPDAWLGVARSVRAGESIPARIMLAASFASALVEPCRALPFFVHLWGGSGAGKTVALQLAASVWADPDSGHFLTTYNATSTALELSAGFLHSLPLCVDELQIDARRDLDETVYQLAEGVGKRRGAKSGGVQRTATWKLCILSTGEMPMTSSSSRGGVLNRCIQIDCKDAPLFRSAPAVSNLVKTTYGHAGRMFVEAVQDMGESAVYELYNGYVKELNRTEGITGKQIMAAAVLLTADRIAEACIFQDGRALSVADVTPYLITQEEADVNRRALTWLVDWIATNPMRFRHTDWGEWQGECWGLIEKDYVYIIGSVLNAKMNEAGFNPTAFLSWARREGVIEAGAGNDKNARNKRIDGQVCRCIWLKRNKIEMDEV